MKFDSRIEEEFYKKYNDANVKYITSTRSYKIKAIKAHNNVPFDISLTVANKTVAIIEFKSSRFIEVFDYSKILKYAAENNIRIIILSDGEKFIVTDRKNPNLKAVFDFQGILTLFKKEDINVEELRIQIADLFKEIISASEFKFLKESIGDLHSQIKSGIEFDEIGQTFSFKNPTDINNIENRIFRLLLKDDKPLTKVYRYTTLNTVYAMLNYNSFRMNCLVGMNDTTEVNYAENYITGTNRDYTQAHWQTVDAYNRRFISSCSLKEDDLTQWRLYSEDSTGVCLILKVNQELLNSKFVLKRISYGRKDGTHPELDFIKLVIATIKSRLFVDFDFKTLSTWRHFFKPCDYAVEEEVRLLFVAHDELIKKGWLLTTSHNILNPYVEFKLNDDDMPLQLAEVVFGPKCPEKEINLKQFEQFTRELRRKKKSVVVNGANIDVDEYNLAKLTFSISKIRNYR